MPLGFEYKCGILHNIHPLYIFYVQELYILQIASIVLTYQIYSSNASDIQFLHIRYIVSVPKKHTFCKSLIVKEPEQAISRFLELYVFIYPTHNLTNIDFHSRICKPPLPGLRSRDSRGFRNAKCQSDKSVYLSKYSIRL